MIRRIKKPDFRIGNVLLLASVILIIVTFLSVVNPALTGAGFTIQPVGNKTSVPETPEVNITEPINETEESLPKIPDVDVP